MMKTSKSIFKKKAPALCLGLWWAGFWLATLFVYRYSLPPDGTEVFLSVWLHMAFFGLWAMGLLAFLRISDESRLGRKIGEKWTFPLVFTLFLLFYIVPFLASWIGCASWGRIISAQIISIFFSGLRQISQLSTIDPRPLLVFLGMILSVFFVFQRKMATPNRQRLAFLWGNRGWEKWTGALAICLTMALIPIIFPMTRQKSIKILWLSNPFTGFYIVSLKAKKEEIMNWRAFRPTISDPNIAPGQQFNFIKKNVFIICADALRADHLAVYGGKKGSMPFLDSLNQTGFFQTIGNAMSIGTSTMNGVYALLYSNYLSEETHSDRPSLAWLLRSQGYEAHFLLSGVHKGWYGMGNFYALDAATIFEGVDSQKYGVNDDRILLEGLENLDLSNKKPVFVYFHLMSSHESGTKWSQFHKHQPENFDFWETKSENQVKAYHNHNLNGAEQADEVIRLLLKKLTEMGILNNSIIWLLADHGDSMGEHDLTVGHGGHFWPEVMRIPLLFHDSEGKNLQNTHFATTLDIAPTTASCLGLPTLQGWKGISLDKPQSNRTTFHTDGNDRAWVYCNTGVFRKIQMMPDSTKLYFDLMVDPTEKNPLPIEKLDNVWRFDTIQM